MSLQSIVQQLQAAGIKAPGHVTNALDVAEAARNARGIRYDASRELTSALAGGALTADNFHESLRNALVKEITSASGPQGAALWRTAEAAEHAAENQVRHWLAVEFEDLLEFFGEQFDQAAAKLTEALPKALPIGASPETVLKFGPKGIAARQVVTEAESTLSSLVAFMRTIAAEIDEPLPLSRFVTPAAGDPLPAESGLWSAYVEQGCTLGLVSPDQAAATEAVAVQLAYQAAAEEWEVKIRREFERMSEFRTHGGRRANFTLIVPGEHAAIIDELAPLYNFGPNQFNHPAVVVL
jgi:hypothetical protein